MGTYGDRFHHGEYTFEIVGHDRNGGRVELSIDTERFWHEISLMPVAAEKLAASLLAAAKEAKAR